MTLRVDLPTNLPPAHILRAIADPMANYRDYAQAMSDDPGYADHYERLRAVCKPDVRPYRYTVTLLDASVTTVVHIGTDRVRALLVLEELTTRGDGTVARLSQAPAGVW